MIRQYLSGGSGVVVRDGLGDAIASAMRRLPDDAADVLQAVATRIGKAAAGETPVRTGRLRSSIRVRVQRAQGSTVTVGMSMGGASAPYADEARFGARSPHRGELIASVALVAPAREAVPGIVADLRRRGAKILGGS